ncbi:MAG: SRPBCC domain-containing protein [Candidatus Sericytochromatia bacterium]
METLPIPRIEIQVELTLAAAPDRIYDALTKEIAAWWGPPYSCVEQPLDLILEGTIGGRFYEIGEDGDAYLWGVITGKKPDARLEITGNCGMGGLVHGLFTYDLAPAEAGTQLRLTHKAIGEVTEDMRANWQTGWQDLLDTRLRAFVERGERMGLEQ